MEATSAGETMTEAPETGMATEARIAAAVVHTKVVVSETAEAVNSYNISPRNRSTLSSRHSSSFRSRHSNFFHRSRSSHHSRTCSSHDIIISCCSISTPENGGQRSELDAANPGISPPVALN